MPTISVLTLSNKFWWTRVLFWLFIDASFCNCNGWVGVADGVQKCALMVGLHKHVGVIFFQLGCDYDNADDELWKGNWRISRATRRQHRCHVSAYNNKYAKARCCFENVSDKEPNHRNQSQWIIMVWVSCAMSWGGFAYCLVEMKKGVTKAIDSGRTFNLGKWKTFTFEADWLLILE